MTKQAVYTTEIPDNEPVLIELTVEAGAWPGTAELSFLARCAVDAACAELRWSDNRKALLSILFFDDDGIAALNKNWRGKQSPTNVLSFQAVAAGAAPGNPAILGDIVLASETVHREAKLENKPVNHHIIHLLVHGFLHLCGYDHKDDEEAQCMEALETRILARLDVPDPYCQ